VALFDQKSAKNGCGFKIACKITVQLFATLTRLQMRYVCYVKYVTYIMPEAINIVCCLAVIIFAVGYRYKYTANDSTKF